MAPPATTDQFRPLSKIAREIAADWKEPYYGARPYIEAMMHINLITDRYLHESGQGVVGGFLANCASWRGEKARAVKTELRKMAASVKPKRR
jgi:hypothetical protein